MSGKWGYMPPIGRIDTMAQAGGAQDFVQVRVAVPRGELAAWEKHMERFEPLSISLDYEYPGGFAVPPAQLGEDWVWLVVLLHNYALPALRSELTDHIFFVKVIKENSWRYGWLAQQKPVALGKRLLVYFRDQERAQADSYRLAIKLDSRDAFGEGAHATTRQTMIFLYGMMKVWARKQRSMPYSLLDVGTGSGLLAILACLLGLKRVVAFDIDPQAAERAQNNWHANCARAKALASPTESEPGVWIGEGDLFSFAGGGFDLITANLQTKILLDGATLLAFWARPGACLIVSGVWFRWRKEIVARFLQEGLILGKEKERQGWCTFLFEKPKS